MRDRALGCPRRAPFPAGGVAMLIMHAMKSPFPGMDPYLEPHWRTLDYRQPLEPPLDDEDAVRAEASLNARK